MSEQPGNKPVPGQSTSKSSTGLQENIAGLLCYIAGWVTGLIFFLIEKDSKFVKFHAMQSIAISVVLIILYTVLGLVPIIGWILIPIVAIIAFILWLLLMYKAYQGKLYKLPVIGDFAAKQAGL